MKRLVANPSLGRCILSSKLDLVLLYKADGCGMFTHLLSKPPRSLKYYSTKTHLVQVPRWPSRLGTFKEFIHSLNQINLVNSFHDLETMHLHLLLSATAGLLTPILAVNSTTIGTNCNIVSNHTVIAGDNLANIATSTNTTVAQLQFVNTQITNPRLINVGDIIKIPNSACVAPAPAPLAEPTATCSNGTASTIKVVAGDTLIIIAKEKLGITLPSLLAVNPQVKNPDLINVGDVLNVPLCGKNGTATVISSKAAKPASRRIRALRDLEGTNSPE
jgi:LysM repeat protein